MKLLNRKQTTPEKEEIDLQDLYFAISFLKDTLNEINQAILREQSQMKVATLVESRKKIADNVKQFQQTHDRQARKLGDLMQKMEELINERYLRKR